MFPAEYVSSLKMLLELTQQICSFRKSSEESRFVKHAIERLRDQILSCLTIDRVFQQPCASTVEQKNIECINDWV